MPGSSVQNEASAHGGRKYIKGLTTRSRTSVEAIQAVLQAQDEVIKSNPALVHCGVIFDYSPKQAVVAVPLEATAYAGRGTVRFSNYPDPPLSKNANSLHHACSVSKYRAPKESYSNSTPTPLSTTRCKVKSAHGPKSSLKKHR